MKLFTTQNEVDLKNQNGVLVQNSSILSTFKRYTTKEIQNLTALASENRIQIMKNIYIKKKKNINTSIHCTVMSITKRLISSIYTSRVYVDLRLKSYMFFTNTLSIWLLYYNIFSAVLLLNGWNPYFFFFPSCWLLLRDAPPLKKITPIVWHLYITQPPIVAVYRI